MSDDEPEFYEGCPDCGRDSVVDTPECVECTYCGWREFAYNPKEDPA